MKGTYVIRVDFDIPDTYSLLQYRITEIPRIIKSCFLLNFGTDSRPFIKSRLLLEGFNDDSLGAKKFKDTLSNLKFY